MAFKTCYGSISLASLFLLHCVTAVPVRSEDGGVRLDLVQAIDTTKVFVNSELMKYLNSDPATISAISAVTKLMESQRAVDAIAELSSDSSHYLVTFKLVMDVLNTKACAWLKDVVQDEDFTCSESDIKTLSLLFSVLNAANKLNEVLSSYNQQQRNTTTDHCNWVNCNILCDFKIDLHVRKYITESFNCPVKPLADSCPIDHSRC